MQIWMVGGGGQPGWPVWLRRRLGGHWFRIAHDSPVTPEEAMRAPCALAGCGRPGREHWRWVGEWMLARRQRWALSLGRLLSRAS